MGSLDSALGFALTRPVELLLRDVVLARGRLMGRWAGF